jgi:DNA replication protein DnaC
VTTPTETCPICGGTGWQTIERGKEREAVRCDCREKGRADRLLAAAHIPPHYEHCELSTFHCDPDNKEQKSIRDARLLAWRFVEEYPKEKRGLLFVGSAGVGKTHLAIGMIKELIRQKGAHCLFCDYRELLKSIQDSYNPAVQVTEMELLRPVLDSDVLLLDDLAAVRSSEWIFDIVNYILNSRYNRDGTTIITTNFPDMPERTNVEFDNLRSKAVAERIARGDTLGDRIGHRMWSRLHELCKKIEMEGPDFRQTSKKAEFEKKQGGLSFSVASKRRLKQALEGQGTLSDQLECAILAVTEMISGHRRGNRLYGWRSLIERRLSYVFDDDDLIAAFERLSGRGILQLTDTDGQEYSGHTAENRESFFRSLFVAQITPEGLAFWESIKK